MNNCHEIEQCIACGSTSLIPVLNLNNQPLANSYKEKKDQEEEFFPLGINRCSDCSHVQLTHKVSPDLLFKNYLYVSGTTKTQLDYFEWFCNYVLENSRSHKTILDIGCNDGSQLNCFKNAGLSTYGIDPAINLYNLSSKNHKVICDYFVADSFDQKFDIIVCQNAFPHNYNQLEFLQNCRQLMHEDTLLYIVTSQADMITNNEFDTIYHEHLSFYTIKSMNAICERAGLNLIDVNQHPIHGKSNIFIVSGSLKRTNHIKNLIDLESNQGLHTEKTYKQYAIKCHEIVDKFKIAIDQLKKDGVTIVGYGAPAKGNTFLNFSCVDLDFIIDDNPLKQGLFTPGRSIPIVAPEILKQFQDKKICFVPLAWNFFEEIKTRIKLSRLSEATNFFLRYFPNVSLQQE